MAKREREREVYTKRSYVDLKSGVIRRAPLDWCSNALAGYCTGQTVRYNSMT
jgi:hypothetical protein